MAATYACFPQPYNAQSLEKSCCTVTATPTGGGVSTWSYPDYAGACRRQRH